MAAPEKRRASTRLNAGVSRKRRRTSVASVPATPEQESEPEKLPPNPLPTRLSDKEHLPLVEGHDRESETGWQSVAESGTLAASLLLSQQNWFASNLFERYWTKPSKKKEKTMDLSKNPPKESMSIIGTCQITIEPHIFEAKLYVIKDLPSTTMKPDSAMSSATPLAQTSPTLSTDTPGSTGAISTQPSLLPPPPSQTQTPTPSRPSPAPTPQAPPIKSSQATPPIPSQSSMSTTWHANTSTASPRTPQPAAKQQDPVIQMLAQRAASNPALKSLMKIVAQGNANAEQLAIFQHHIDDLNAILQLQKQQKQAQAALTTPHNEQDEVTQMLVERAKSKHSIHNLIEMVASGSANYNQRRDFQIQIDEITTTIQNEKHRKIAQSALLNTTSQQDPLAQLLGQRSTTNHMLQELVIAVAAGSADGDQRRRFQGHLNDLTAILEKQKLTPATPTTPHTGGAFNSSYNRLSNYAAPPMPRQQHPLSSMAYPQPYKTTPPVKQKPHMSLKPEIRGAAIEFVGGSSDRFWFPRHSVLEWLPGNRQIRATFVVRKEKLKPTGTAKPKAKAKNAAETPDAFYQPVTMLVSSDKPLVLEQLVRGVASLDEACRHIDEVKATCTRAEPVHLALRLPRTSPPPSTAHADVTRRQSLLWRASGTSPAPVADVKPARGRHKHDDYGPACQFCFASLAGAGMGAALVCASCASLVPRAAAAAEGGMGLFGYLAGQATAGRALMMST